MEEKKKCMCGCSDVRVVACCGASNVGQIANQAAIELAKEKIADSSAWREWAVISEW